MTTPSLRVGWIGTGRMGSAMAGRLARAGHDVTVWNRTRSKAEPLAELGAKVADSIADLRDLDVVFTMVSAPPDLEQVLLGDGGLLADPSRVPGAVVDTSTVSAEASARMRCRLRRARRGLPRRSGERQRQGGAVPEALSLVVSGPEKTFEQVRHLLDELGKGATWVGEGDESRLVKIAHNLMLGVVTQCLAEITVLCEKGGVPRHAFLEFLNNSVMGSTFTRYKSPAFVNLDFTPTFTPVLLRKDFDLGFEAAHELDVPMPVCAATAASGPGERRARVTSRRTSRSCSSSRPPAPALRLQAENVEVDDGLSAAD